MTAPKNKDHKPPPIIITGVKINDAIKLLCANKITKNDVRLKQVNPSDNITITCFNLEVYTKVNKVFIDNQTQYYTYTPKSQKPKTIILKGVNGDFNEKDIKNELEELKIPNIEIIKVNPIIFKNRHGQDIKHHLVQVTSESEINELTKIKGLLFQPVKWENLRKKIIFQCRNCQKLGHSKANCHLPPKCVKCGDSHAQDECQIKKEDNREALKCANCGKNGHPANCKGCEYYKNAIKLVKEQKNEKRARLFSKIQKINRYVDPNQLYTEALNQNQTSVHTPRVNLQKEVFPQLPATSSRPEETATPPQWAKDLLGQFNMINQRLTAIEKQINNNNTRINYLLEINNIDVQQQ